MTLDVTAIQGACDERFASVREIFAERIASGEDFGGSLKCSWISFRPS